MKTLIIPCCGKSMIGSVPNWLARHPNGQYLIEECVNDLQSFDLDRIVIPILEEDDSLYAGKEKLNSILSHIVPSPEILLLKEKTSCPAETIYLTIKEAGLDGSLVIHDSDVKLKISHKLEGNFIVGLDLMQCKGELPDIRKKAGVIRNNNNIILDIIEKQIRSSTVCYGMYGFDRANDFVAAYEALSDPLYGIQQLFVSNIIAYLIGAKNQIFHYISVQEYEDWDNLREWFRLEKGFGTYFVNYDMLGNDIQYEQLRTLQSRGAKLVFYTVKDDEFRDVYNKKLKSMGIAVHALITGCSYGASDIIKNPHTLYERVVEVT